MKCLVEGFESLSVLKQKPGDAADAGHKTLLYFFILHLPQSQSLMQPRDPGLYLSLTTLQELKSQKKSQEFTFHFLSKAPVGLVHV